MPSLVSRRLSRRQPSSGEAAESASRIETRGVSLRRWLMQDWEANYRTECRLILVWFRLAQWARARSELGGLLLTAPYRLIVTLLIGVDLSPHSPVGPGLRLIHPQAIVVHRETKIGANVTMLHGVTIGNANDRAGGRGGVPSIGDHVELGAGCVVLGDVEIGDHARIGANAVVTKSVPPWAVVVGVPGTIIKVDQYPPPER